MTVPGNLSSPLLATAGAGEAAAAGPIKSVRFNSADIAYLNKDFGSAGNRRAWTWSAWVKRTAFSATQCLFFGGATDSTLTRVIFGNDTLELQNFDSSTFNVRVETNHHFEDPSAWYHFIIAVDTNQTTEADRVKMYINGVRETSFLAADYPEEGQQLHISNNVTHSIGVEDSSATYYRFNGYMADVFFIDGQQLDETSFGAFDSNGVWQAAAYSGTFGTNGFHLFDFANESTVGHDSSGNENDFTASGISTTAGAGNDVLFDVPTNGTQSDTGAGGEVSANYCTLNPSHHLTNATLANGNLQTTSSAVAISTFLLTSGKWYCEHTVTATGYNLCFTQPDHPSGNTPSDTDSKSIGWYIPNGYVYWGGNNSSANLGGTTMTGLDGSGYMSNAAVGDIVAAAIDMDNSTIKFYKNGSEVGSIDFSTGTAHRFADGMYISQFNGYGDWNFGQRAFSSSAPNNHKALCTANLPVSTLPDGSNHFDILTWDGLGSGSRSFTGLSFQPDLTWVKIRTQSYTHTIYDSVRGAGSGKELQSDSTNGEGQANTDQYGYLSSFNSDGFSSTAGSSDNDYFNKSGNSYVAWNWNAGANSNKTYSVKVVNDGGNNKYRFDDSSVSGYILELAEGSTYTFDCSDSSCDSHPFLIGSGSSVLSSGVVYTLDGVTKTFNQYTSGFAAATTRKLTLTIPASAPAYYYYCHVHSGMGATINTNATAGSSNLDGTEGAVVKANQAAGFSIITLNFGSVSGTISVGHGLNAAPHFWIMKDRDSADAWYVGHISIGAGYYLRFGRTSSGTESLSSKIASTTLWDNTLPSNSLIYSNGTAMDGAGDYLMLAWAPVEGYSSFGSYVGNGLSNGPFVSTSFKVGFLMVKSHSASGAWRTYDSKRKTFNTINNSLHWDTNEDETVYSNDEIDFYSNGFKPKATGSFHNGSGVEYIYAAFAENPFQANGGLAR